MPEKEIGKISHYFSKIGVAIIELTDSLKVGDAIHIKGHSEDFQQTVDSMQVEHKDATEANAGDSVGIKVTSKVHENDVVFKVTE
ncbi:MAG: translation elongation factor-like protein [Candidatus Omnitrophica bacterium]|nr:translation elongation factor-like protein [Candidatus Omnitrophota bacterium]